MALEKARTPPIQPLSKRLPMIAPYILLLSHMVSFSRHSPAVYWLKLNWRHTPGHRHLAMGTYWDGWSEAMADTFVRHLIVQLVHYRCGGGGGRQIHRHGGHGTEEVVNWIGLGAPIRTTMLPPDWYANGLVCSNCHFDVSTDLVPHRMGLLHHHSPTSQMCIPRTLMGCVCSLQPNACCSGVCRTVLFVHFD